MPHSMKLYDDRLIAAGKAPALPAVFIRAMVLPADIKGEMSNVWLSDALAMRANWRLFIDQEITV